MITQKRTKLITTIGPASESHQIMSELFDNGMTTIRLNFSHGNHETHLKKFVLARKIMCETLRPISIMLDTKGPEIRIGKMKDGAQKIRAKTQLIINCNPMMYANFEGNDKEITVSYNMHNDLKPGNRVVIDDGKLVTIVEKIEDEKIHVNVINDHVLKTNKRVNLPGVNFSLPFLSDHDRDDIVFGIENDIDYIAASFVNTRENVQEIKKILAEHDANHIQIISKIESELGIKNIEEIIDESHGIMVARGDLGLEIPFEDVPYWQKKIIRSCREKGKPVIVATQMLDSMEVNPQPTRAEVTDVYFAVELGTDATMLSGESASGKFPVLATATMSKIALRAELEYYHKLYYPIQLEKVSKNIFGPRAEIAKKIAYKLQDGDYSFAVVLSRTGELLKTVSRFRPNASIIGICLAPHSFTAFGIWSSVFMVENKDDLYSQIRKDHSKARDVLKIYGIFEGEKYIVVENDSFKEYVY